MGLDQSALQLVCNVVVITGVTSLAVICYLLRQDNKKLTLKLRIRERQRYISTPRTNGVAPEVLGHESECTPALKVPVGHQDIRQFVARRSQEWNDRTAAKVG